MENFNKEEVSVFKKLNYRHQQLLIKLSELNERLHYSTISLGGDYPLEINELVQNPTDGSHMNNYANQLDYLQSKLTFMFKHIERLEHLVSK